MEIMACSMAVQKFGHSTVHYKKYCIYNCIVGGVHVFYIYIYIIKYHNYVLTFVTYVIL